MEKSVQKIVVVGKNGRLGKTLLKKVLESSESNAINDRNYDGIGFGRREVNLDKLDDIVPALENLDFDYLINCAAQTLVDDAEDDAEKSMRINGLAPKILAEICKAKNAKMVHISTDYVFQGDDAKLKTEEDETEPLGVYANTKLEGEKNVLAVSEDNLIFRVSWLFGPMKKSFVDSILARAMEDKEVKVIADKFSCPTYTPDLANYILASMEKLRGVFHICNSGACSWLEYAEGVINIARDLGMKIKCEKVSPLLLSEFDSFVAPRPKHTAMSCQKFIEYSGIEPRHWKEAITEYLQNYYIDKLPKQS